ncbi:guanosine-3',5'-bis(diphosphate) 3'-pyrophosphohydrolase-like [Hibiscus syriacus]|uniref:Guanosine-3',5'-bis(Diphosphate) 3'-pyrophosphohydrolase-like n=1 Tax=Hibiscus syriacus TaxID=106335 RepID=A0A6A3A4Z2_HIBSY|nr:guanosine-3',5'-bis(diphosphate) 3'-pyrophosphohydrolase-like [Hibiscus syriacus]
MAGKKIIAICQSGGDFVTNKDGSLSYNGGEAYAIDINEHSKLSDFKSEIKDMFNLRSGNMSIKYFLPGNKKTLITISKDKDLQRMLNFIGETSTVDVFIVPEEAAARNVSNMPASRSSGTTISEVGVPIVAPANADVGMINGIDQLDLVMPNETPLDCMPIDMNDGKHLKAAEVWENTITGVDQRFNSFNEFREAVHKYSVAHGFAYRFKKNNHHRATVKCKAQGCPWRIFASQLSTTQLICIKKMNTTHTCEGAAVKAGHGQQGAGWETWRAIEIAKEQLRGSIKEAYNLLPYFCCRPLIFLDSTILNSKYGGMLLAATAADAEDGIFPVAFAVVDAENEDNWTWFLRELKSAVSTSSQLTFVADFQNGLKQALADVFDKCYHSYCLKHLADKLIGDLKGQFSHDARRFMINDFYTSARAPRLEGFQQAAENLKAISPEVYDWVIQSEPEHWANAFFGGARYNHMVSSFGQEFYSWVSEAHEFPITHMINLLRGKMMESIYKRRVDSSQWMTTLTPSNEEKLQKETAMARSLQVLLTHGSIFEVRGECVEGTSVEVVNIDHWDCSCKGWQHTGLPCCHAIAVFECIGRSPYDYCSRYFTTESFRLTYSESIHPVPNVEGPIEDESLEVAVTVTPPTECPPGRPKKKQESIDLLKRQLQCSKCKGLGHNKKTCKTTLV